MSDDFGSGFMHCPSCGKWFGAIDTCRYCNVELIPNE